MEKINKKIVVSGVFLIFIYQLVVNFSEVQNWVNYFIKVTSPILWGLVIAYLLEPLVKKILEKTKMKRRGIVVFIFVTLVVLITMSILSLMPAISNSIKGLMNDFPNFKIQIINFVTSLNDKYEFLQDLEIGTKITEFITNSNGKSLEFLNNILKSILENSVGISKTSMNIFMSLIISYYLLIQKDEFLKNTNKIFKKLVNDDNYKSTTKILKKSNDIFLNYLVGKLLDSAIIAVITFVGMWILKVPYAILFAFIMGLTNMIPYFGPFIGAVPVILVTLFYSPVQALLVGIFILIVQQVDGLIIGPKILGDKVGVGPFWIIVSILIGGNMFGVMGMLISVPIAAVIIDLVSEYAQLNESNKKLRTKKHIKSKKA